jgi:hypothetical protein
MPAQGQRVLGELRAAGFEVTYGNRGEPYVKVDGLLRPSFVVTPASKLSPAQRADLKAHRRSICYALELEAIEARTWDPADGPDPDGMHERWLARCPTSTRTI